MSDRTQTLSVELEREEIRLLLSGRDPDPTSQEAADRERARGKLRAALSQPEHQGEDGSWYFDAPPEGDGPAEDLVAALSDLDATLAKLPVEEQRRYRECEESVLRARGFVPFQPPAPALSDKERERLIRIADDPRWRLGLENAQFLRYLASREHPDA